MVNRIVFQIQTDGEVSVNVDGATGTKCESLTKPFEDILGRVEKKNYKESFYCADVPEVLEEELEENQQGQFL